MLSEEQGAATVTRLPAIVSGTAGSGKTCVAIEMLLSQASRSRSTHDPEVPPILYVSKSMDLVREASRIWNELVVDNDEIKSLVLFKSYDQLLQENLNGSAFSIADDRSAFQSWYAQAKRPMEDRTVWDLKLNNLPIMSGGRKIAFDEYGYHRIGSISSLN